MTQYYLGWNKQLTDLRDYRWKARAAQVAALPPSADIRLQDTPIFDQGALGSCTANAGVGAFQWLQNARQGNYFQGSRLYVYKETRDMEGTTGDNGATLRGTAKEMAKRGVPPEMLWPYNIDKFDVEPPLKVKAVAIRNESTNYYLIDGATGLETLNNIKAAVAIGVPLPVMFGTTVYESIMTVGKDGMIPKPGGHIAGGHAMLIVGYDDSKQCLLIRNSWGLGWGMEGYGWLPYSYVTSGLVSDCWVIAAESEMNPPAPRPKPNMWVWGLSDLKSRISNIVQRILAELFGKGEKRYG